LVRLVRYDLMILWKSGRAAFSTRGDIVLLLLAMPIALVAALSGARQAAPALGALPLVAKLLLTAGIALGANVAVRRRLAHLREESVVARYALRRGPAIAHATFWNFVPFLAVAVGMLAAAREERLALTPLLLASYLAGVGLAALKGALRDRLAGWRNRRRAAARRARPVRFRGASREARARELIAARAGLFRLGLAANLLLFAALGALIGLGRLGGTRPPAPPVSAVLAGLLILLLLALLLRQHPPLLRYLLFLGTNAAVPAALIPTAMAGALVGGFLIAGGAAGAGPAAMLLWAAALLLLFALLALLRALHYATRSRQSAEIAIQLDLAALFIAGWVAPPLVPVALALRLFLLSRRVRDLRYAVP